MVRFADKNASFVRPSGRVDITRYVIFLDRMSMTGAELKQGRLAAKLTQAEAAARLGFTQPYLSLLERGRRTVTPAVARAATRLYGLPPTALAPPLEPPVGPAATERLPFQLATLGYPGYGHLRKGSLVNPAAVALSAVSADQLDGRVAEAMPWVLQQYPTLDWTWLVTNAKLRNVQNRLGFLVTAARRVAERRSDHAAAEKLERVERELEPARLAAETTLGREAMPEVERAWLRRHRSAEARHWNVLVGMKVEELPYAS